MKRSQNETDNTTKKIIEINDTEVRELVRGSVEETLNNLLERIIKEIRRRTRVVGSFPDGRSALMLVAARLRHIAGTKWGTKRYLSMDRRYELERLKEAI